VSALARILDGVIAVAIAPQCAACNRILDTPLEGPVCAACWSAVRPVSSPYCQLCGDPLQSWRVLSTIDELCARCRRVKPTFSCARAAGVYEGSLREIIQAFKYDDRRSLAEPLAGMIHRECADILRGADLIVPVPLHPWRRWRRGFNQAEELARYLDLPMCNALWRTRATLPQAGLRPAQRRRNLRGAFRLSPLLVPERVRGARVVLVDDVRTTGATLDACARVLVTAGAREVRAVTVAGATGGQPPGRR
jgi:ComF family protein